MPGMHSHPNTDVDEMLLLDVHEISFVAQGPFRKRQSRNARNEPADACRSNFYSYYAAFYDADYALEHVKKHGGKHRRILTAQTNTGDGRESKFVAVWLLQFRSKLVSAEAQAEPELVLGPYSVRERRGRDGSRSSFFQKEAAEAAWLRDARICVGILPWGQSRF